MRNNDDLCGKFMGIILGVILIFSTCSFSWGGQVVTGELESWAKNVIGQEKNLKGLEGQNTIGVLYFQAKTDQDYLQPLQKGLSIMLITDLSKLKDFDVVDRIHLQALLKELKLSGTGLIDEKTKLKLGKLLKARWLIGGELDSLQKNGLGISSHLVDSPKKKVLGNPGIKGPLKQLLQLEKKLLFDLVALLKIKLTPEERIELEKPLTLNLDALFAYFKGINASDNGDYDKAAGYYQEATKLDSDFKLPKIALLELIDLKLIKRPSHKKRIKELVRKLRDRTSLTDELTPEAPTKRIKKPHETVVQEQETGGDTFGDGQQNGDLGNDTRYNPDYW